MPTLEIVSTLVKTDARMLQQKDNEGMLPVHRYINRPNPDMEIVSYLLDNYVKCTLRHDKRKRTALHFAVDHSDPSEECVKALLLAFSKACEIPDVDGYLPLHYLLDGDRSNPIIAKLLIDAYPVAVSKPTKDGYLPLHCLLCNDYPNLEIANRLIQLFPQGVQQVAVDLVPADEKADPLTWVGPLKEKRWTPLSKAIDKGLLDVITLLQSALPKTIDDGPNFAMKKGPLSGMRNVRPQPAGVMPPSLRQAAHFAKTVGVGKPKVVVNPAKMDYGEDGTESAGSSSARSKPVGRPPAGAPNPAVYFKSPRGGGAESNRTGGSFVLHIQIHTLTQSDANLFDTITIVSIACRFRGFGTIRER